MMMVLRDISEMPSFFAPPSDLPDISPSRGEIMRFIRRSLFVASGIWGSLEGSVISPLEGEMSGRTEGGEPIQVPAIAFRSFA
jgi:hypothetical protein